MKDTSRKDAGRNGAKLKDTRRDGGKALFYRRPNIKRPMVLIARLAQP